MSIIPGLFSKDPRQTLFHRYYRKANGVYIDGFLDFSYMGLGSCILGYADPDVNRAVKKAIDGGSMSALNCREEMLLENMFQQFNPWMKSIRFAKCGGDAVFIAYKYASYFKDSKKYCTNGYCGWQLSHFDRSVEVENCYRIDFCDIEQLRNVPDDIKIYIIELARSDYVSNEWVEVLKEKTRGKILIIDEITSGFRNVFGGIYSFQDYNLKPDFVCYGKAIGNGFPISVIVGNEIMDMIKDEVFISSTMYTDRVGLAACVATLAKIFKKNVVNYICDYGKEYKLLLKKYGIPSLPAFGIVEIPDFSNDATIRFYTEKILWKSRFYPSFSHDEKHLRKLENVFQKIIKESGKKNEM
jgi:glutamate-1-semialdehyde aminotransferase